MLIDCCNRRITSVRANTSPLRTRFWVESQCLETMALKGLSEYPVAVESWKVYAELGRLHKHLNHPDAARQALVNASSVIETIANHTVDEGLRNKFLDSAVVKEIVAGAGKAATQDL